MEKLIMDTLWWIFKSEIKNNICFTKKVIFIDLLDGTKYKLCTKRI